MQFDMVEHFAPQWHSMYFCWTETPEPDRLWLIYEIFAEVVGDARHPHH